MLLCLLSFPFSLVSILPCLCSLFEFSPFFPARLRFPPSRLRFPPSSHPPQLTSEITKLSTNFQKAQLKHGAVLYDSHVRFLDFHEQGKPQPLYINLLREPVARAVSSYYYGFLSTDRPADSVEQRQKIRGSQKDLDINECLALPKHNRTCGFRRADMNLMASFFCGHDEVCRCLHSNTVCSPATRRQAFLLAKSNLRLRYTVVGILEYMEESLELLEAKMPQLFGGLTDFKIPRVRAVTHPGYVKPTLETQRKLAEEELALDVELYQYAVQLFNTTYQACMGRPLGVNADH
jgi:hypothetical protein